MNKYLLTFLYLIVLLAISCEHDIVVPNSPDSPTQNSCDTTKVYFQNDILPILVSSCAFSGCHDAGTATKGVVLTTYNNIIQSNIIEAGNATNSKIYERITNTDPNERMPLGATPLNNEQIDKIRIWIEEGAENTSCDPISDCDTTNITYSAIISPIITNKCQGCHNGTNPGGGISLTNYNEVSGIAADLRLLNVILHSPGFKKMPLGGSKLPQCEIEAIRIWINNGYPNN